MPIFRLEGDDLSKAELIIAPKTNLELEKHLENWLENSPRALAQELFLWIGRQTSAKDEEGTIFPDLLGVDSEGNLIIVEFKRGRTPRDVVAQLLEYAAWADELSESQIREIAETHFETRGVFEGKTFDDAFREVFDMPETDEIPPLNRNLRLFIVAEEIPSRMARVCRFLRTSHGMDISCIDVSTFQTESGETIVSMEMKVGNEDGVVPQSQVSLASQNSRWSEDKSTKEVFREVVQELTKGDYKVEFTQENVRALILAKYPNFNKNTLRRLINEDRVNDPGPNHHTIVNRDGKYWRISRGIYRLYDPKKDKVTTDDK